MAAVSASWRTRWLAVHASRSLTGSSRSRARCARAGAGGRCAPARAADRAPRSCARRARGSVRRRAGRAPGYGCVGVQRQLVERQLDPAGLGVMRIEVDDHRAPCCRRPAASCCSTSSCVVVDRMEAQASSRDCSAGLLAPDRVDARDEVAQAVRPLEVPVADLVLLRVEIFLAARLARLVLQQLEGRAVDAVAGRQRRGQHQPHHERRPAAELQVLGAGCRACWARQFGRKYSRPGPCVSSVKYSVSSGLVLRQVK